MYTRSGHSARERQKAKPKIAFICRSDAVGLPPNNNTWPDFAPQRCIYFFSVSGYRSSVRPFHTILCIFFWGIVSPSALSSCCWCSLCISYDWLFFSFSSTTLLFYTTMSYCMGRMGLAGRPTGLQNTYTHIAYIRAPRCPKWVLLRSFLPMPLPLPLPLPLTLPLRSE